VVIEANGDAREVNCDQPHAGTVARLFATADGLCPLDTEEHRDRQGMGRVCVRMGG
jgi:hypothetical protein